MKKIMLIIGMAFVAMSCDKKEVAPVTTVTNIEIDSVSCVYPLYGYKLTKDTLLTYSIDLNYEYVGNGTTYVLTRHYWKQTGIWTNYIGGNNPTAQVVGNVLVIN